MIAPDVLARTDSYKEAFQSSELFPHVVIEGFFEPEKAEALLANFPSFEDRYALNEIGLVGGKAVRTDISAIHPFYAEVSNYIASRPFLDAISRITGIADLIADPSLYGGGTHENLHGQELDPHVDFNRMGGDHFHRRLNLLLYLNKGWRSEWGGSIELHSNPRDPEGNEIQSYAPTFNRAVIFETSERSWHGFEKIDLPESERERSRKCLSVYLYTKTRPAEEIAPPHATFYVPRPLPDCIREGHVLTKEDATEVKRLIVRRDGILEFHQKRELELSGVAEHLQDYLRVPMVGWGLQQGPVEDYWADGWVAPVFQMTIGPRKKVGRITIRGFIPDEMGPRSPLRARVDASEVGTFNAKTGNFEWEFKLQESHRKPFTLAIEGSKADRGPNPALSDSRNLLFVLREIELG